MPPKMLFETMIGTWEGACRTWFEPGQLADESNVTGEISSILGGRFLRHAYSGTLLGKPRNGDETIAFNSVTKLFQTAWTDDFHMNYAMLFSQGEGTAQGFRVRGNYDVGENQPQWGWRTEFQLLDDNHLTITAWNIDPEGNEAMAIETTYHRVQLTDESNR